MRGKDITGNNHNSVKIKLRLIGGKLRRLYYSKFSQDYIKQQLVNRRGECKRCGICCRFVFKCPFLRQDVDGIWKCIIHRWRPSVCVHYPVDQRDLDEREFLQPENKCGFYFVETGIAEPVKSK
ncbi:MAG: hypothetical protein N2246_04050 [Candidatus Sumerlaeia bacterium]|nr:hypothetical protein [Candidatus Sumerlaeia bacterium]